MTLQQSNLTTQHCGLQTLLLQFYCRLSTVKNFLLYSSATVSFHGTVSFKKCIRSAALLTTTTRLALRWCSLFPVGLSGFFPPKSTYVCHLPCLAAVHIEYSALKCSYWTVKGDPLCFFSVYQCFIQITVNVKYLESKSEVQTCRSSSHPQKTLLLPRQ